MKRVLVLLFALVVVVACGSERGVYASDYDQSCTADSDCVVVGGLDVASNDDCMELCDGAVNLRERDRYEHDFESRKGRCHRLGTVFCDVLRPICRAGKCTDERCAVTDATCP